MMKVQMFSTCLLKAMIATSIVKVLIVAYVMVMLMLDALGKVCLSIKVKIRSWTRS